MEFHVDGRRVAIEPHTNGTVDDILEPVRRDTVASGQFIVGLRCDGVDVFGPELSSVLTRRILDCRSLEVQTGDPKDMVSDALTGALAALPDVDGKQAEVIVLFGNGKTADALALLSECIGEWLKINDVIVQSLALLNDHGEAFIAQSNRLAEMIRPVHGKLTDIKDAVTSQDFVAVSDILEYEFSDVSRCWRSTIESMLQHIETLSPATAPD